MIKIYAEDCSKTKKLYDWNIMFFLAIIMAKYIQLLCICNAYMNENYEPN